MVTPGAGRPAPSYATGAGAVAQAAVDSNMSRFYAQCRSGH